MFTNKNCQGILILLFGVTYVFASPEFAIFKHVETRRRSRQLVAYCPPPFLFFRSTCFHAFCDVTKELDWKEARAYCHSIGPGIDLAILDDGCKFADAVAYVRTLTSVKPKDSTEKCNYWIGGSDADAQNRSNEGDWRWINGLPMPRGAPFWAANDHGNDTAPETGENDLDFAFLDKENFYLMKDEDPLYLKGGAPLCQMLPLYYTYQTIVG